MPIIKARLKTRLKPISNLKRIWAESKGALRFHAIAGFVPFAPWLYNIKVAHDHGDTHSVHVYLVIGLVLWFLYFLTNCFSANCEGLIVFTIISVVFAILLPMFHDIREKHRQEKALHSRHAVLHLFTKPTILGMGQVEMASSLFPQKANQASFSSLSSSPFSKGIRTQVCLMPNFAV